MVVQTVVRPPTAPELRLLGRGLPTDYQVQDRIAERMLVWLQPALDKLWRQVRMAVQKDIADGVIAVGYRAKPAWDDEEFWEEVSGGWSAEITDWIGVSAAGVAGYQARRLHMFVDMRLLNDQALRYVVEYYIPTLIKLDGDMSIVQATRQRVKDDIARWQRGELPAGRGIADLQKALSKYFSVGRARRIAVTEATRVYATANRLAWQNAYKDPQYQQAFGITAMRWNTARDDIVCPICAPLNSKQVLLGEDFPVEGGTPPAHPDCRCWSTPIKKYNPKFRPKGG